VFVAHGHSQATGHRSKPGWLGFAYLHMKDGDHLGCFFGITRGSE